MKQLYFFALGLLFAVGTTAHPGIGIVCDSRGNIFYSDLENSWKTGPDGNSTIVVHNVHSHELSLDAGDNLYGEDGCPHQVFLINQASSGYWKIQPATR